MLCSGLCRSLGVPVFTVFMSPLQAAASAVNKLSLARGQREHTNFNLVGVEFGRHAAAAVEVELSSAWVGEGVG